MDADEELQVLDCCEHCAPDAVCGNDHERPCQRCADGSEGYR